MSGCYNNSFPAKVNDLKAYSIHNTVCKLMVCEFEPIYEILGGLNLK